MVSVNIVAVTINKSMYEKQFETVEDQMMSAEGSVLPLLGGFVWMFMTNKQL